MLARWLFLLARQPPVHALVRWGFARPSPVLPVHRVATTNQVLACFHPRPSWSPHILLVPRRSIPSLLAVRLRDSAVIADLLRLAAAIVSEHAPPGEPAVLLANGGTHQEVGQLHFHLTWGPVAAPYACLGDGAGTPSLWTAEENVLPHPRPAGPSTWCCTRGATQSPWARSSRRPSR